jgi:hypothetical protein
VRLGLKPTSKLRRKQLSWKQIAFFQL